MGRVIVTKCLTSFKYGREVSVNRKNNAILQIFLPTS